jgi:hypothetical protein
MGAAEHLLADIGNGSAYAAAASREALHGTGGKPGLVADHDGTMAPRAFFSLVRDQVADLRHRHDRDFRRKPFLEPFLRGALLQLRNELALDSSMRCRRSVP